MEQQISIIITILAALLTGGFLMIFIESHQVANNLADRFYFIMRPFFHSFTSYTRFISGFKSYFYFNGIGSSGYMKRLKDNLELISKIGGKSIIVGQDYPVDYFTSEKLDKICNVINDIWYCIREDPQTFKKVQFDTNHADSFSEHTLGYLEEISPIFKGKELTKELLEEVSAKFYVGFYQPVEHVLPEYEYWQKKEREFKIFSMGTIVFTLFSMLLLLLYCYIPICILAILCVVSSILLLIELYKLIRLENMSKKIMR